MIIVFENSCQVQSDIFSISEKDFDKQIWKSAFYWMWQKPACC